MVTSIKIPANMFKSIEVKVDKTKLNLPIDIAIFNSDEKKGSVLLTKEKAMELAKFLQQQVDGL